MHIQKKKKEREKPETFCYDISRKSIVSLVCYFYRKLQPYRKRGILSERTATVKRVRVNLKGIVCKIVEILTGKKWRFDVSIIGIKSRGQEMVLEE